MKMPGYGAPRRKRQAAFGTPLTQTFGFDGVRRCPMRLVVVQVVQHLLLTDNLCVLELLYWFHWLSSNRFLGRSSWCKPLTGV